MLRLDKPLPKQRTSLQRQMTLTLSAIIAGVILLVGLPMVLISVQMQQRQDAGERRQTAETVAETVAGIIQSIKTDQAQTTATPSRPDPRIAVIATQIATGLNLSAARSIEGIRTSPLTTENATDFFSANPQINGVAQFQPNGNLLAEHWRTSAVPVNTHSIPQTELFDLAAQGINAQDTAFILPAQTPVLLIAAPVFNGEQISSIIVAWVNVLPVWQSLTDLAVGETGYLYITDLTGQVVMAPTQFAQTAPGQPITPVNNQKPYTGLNGNRVLGHTAPIKNTPWQIVIEIPYAEATAGLRALLIILAAILMFGLSLAISMARFFSGRLLQPILTLQQSAQKISDGDLAHRITLNRTDELGFLADAFNRMVATLEKTITQLRTVTMRLLSAEEAERRRIAYEIHDELGQTLTALKFSLSMAERTSPDNPNLQAAQQMASRAQEKARTLSHELRPAMLDDLGLLPTLEWYINRFEQRANLAVSLQSNDLNETALPPELKTTLYRLITEALTNISKHAHASAVDICLLRQAQTLHLTIADDGQGFNVKKLEQTTSLGIAAMRERVNLLHGNFLIESEAEEGTAIKITIPL